jgi:hypothetical protein
MELRTSKESSPLASNRLAVYLAGSIQKGHEPSNELFWAEADMQLLTEALGQNQIAFLNPALRMDDISSQKSVFGRDMLMVFCSDFVLVDARQRRGLGVGAEMMWAKMNKTPLIVYAPQDTHYRLSKASLLGATVENWVHPFVESLSDCIAGTLSEAAAWMQKHLRGETPPAKGAESIQEAMAYYHTTQYANDLPMQELVNTSENLRQRMLRAIIPKK